MTVEIVGYKKKAFTAPDGANISGYDLHVMGLENGVTGNYVERMFCSERKLNGYLPTLGDVVEISYNRFGKIDTIKKSEE